MDLSGINVNLIVALRALLRERNVTRAARKVGLGQSSMSHALARLRDHFGDPLLLPAGRKLLLTERAQALIQPVEEAVARLEQVFLTPSRFEPLTSKRVFRLMAPDNLELYLLPPLLALLSREAPNVSLRIVPLNSGWEEALASGEVDLKLGRRYPVNAGLLSEDLLEERFVCVVASGHAAAGKRLTLPQYAGLRHLVITPTGGQRDSVGTFIDQLLERRKLRRQIALTVSHFVVAPMIVASTDLALTAAERLVAPFIERRELRRVELPFSPASYGLSQVWSSRSTGDEGHAWLRQAIVRVTRSIPS
jgi:DNA-binding transcriptional LysR family regulator